MIFKDIYFSVLEGSEGLLLGIKNILANLFLPSVLATNNWGALNQTKQGEFEKQAFTETLNRYMAFLDGKNYREKEMSSINLRRLILKYYAICVFIRGILS